MAQSKSEKRSARKTGSSNPLSNYLRETRGELRKVTWPTRQESQRLTAIVIGVTAAMAVFLGLLDLIFSNVVQTLVELVAGV